jgi:hypothetical protein
MNRDPLKTISHLSNKRVYLSNTYTFRNSKVQEEKIILGINPWTSIMGFGSIKRGEVRWMCLS